MAVGKFIPSCLFFIIFSLITLSSSSPSHSLSFDQSTVSLQLHHVDSLLHRHHIATRDALFNLHLRRDTARADSIFRLVAAKTKSTASTILSHDSSIRPTTTLGLNSSIIPGIALGTGDYLIRIGVGTPVRYFYLAFDTGSDILWLQCTPCRKCYNQSDPIFNPTRSSTFAPVACSSPLCTRLDARSCDDIKNKCIYVAAYLDNSTSIGNFSTETITFRKIPVKNVAFGCGHHNQGVLEGAAGVLGLGRGKLSFPTQLGRRFGHKFSYCLPELLTDSPKPSWIIFGKKAVPRNVIYTPLISNPKVRTLYYVGLTGISVAGKRVRGITPSMFMMDPSGDGGVIFDSGTVISRLTRLAYVALRDAFLAAASSALKRAPTNDSAFDTCFYISSSTMGKVDIPKITLHFAGGADMVLPEINTLFPRDTEETLCLAFMESPVKMSILGTVQQQGFRIVYDVHGSRIGFSKHVVC